MTDANNELMKTDEVWMAHALVLAQKAADAQEVPVGAVIVRDGKVLGEGYNQPISGCDPTAHAEIMALRAAAVSESNYRLPGATLYVTIEPCTMCFGAIIHSRVSRVVFGASEPKAGMVVSHSALNDASFFNHSIEWVGGVLAQESSAMMQAFFKHRREAKKKIKQRADQNKEGQ